LPDAASPIDDISASLPPRGAHPHLAKRTQATVFALREGLASLDEE